MKSNHKKFLQASMLIAISAVLYGFLGFFGTNVLQNNMSLSSMLFWRFFIAGGWISLFVLRKFFIEKKINQIDKHALIFMLGLGSVGYAASSAFYFIASQYIGTGMAMVTFFSYPIIVALVSWRRKRHAFNAMTALALFSMIIGLFLLQNSSSHAFNLLGIVCGITAAACYAFYVMGSKHISSVTTDSNLLTILVCWGCAFIFLVLSISAHAFSVPESIKIWFYLLAIGILATALPIQLMLEGLKYVSSMRASIISVIEPLITVSIGMVWLDESVSNVQILGILVVICSALGVQFQKKL